MTMNKSYTHLYEQRPFGWEFNGYQGLDSFEFERLHPFYWYEFFMARWYWSWYAGGIYIATIFGLQRYMRSRPAFELKWPLFLWNISLGIFSIVGFARTFPGFVYVLLQPNGFYTSLCFKKYLNVPTTYWAFLFGLSKMWELGDTVFIVLRKRPLILLHWYHHLVTMIGMWICGPYMEPIARWTIVINYCVHSLMYPYFALKSIGIPVPHKVANFITTLQLAQMIIGVIVNLATMLLQQTGYDCVRHPLSIKVALAGYTSFAFLFGKLYYDSVFKNGRERKTKLT